MKTFIYCSLIVAGLMLALGAPLNAQTIRVQSGDHPGFTRLVLQIGADRDWELQQQPDEQWVLDLTPAVDGFDTSSAFNLIQRARLSDLVATQTLSLDLACACDVTSFRHDSRYLVIDITDPDPNAPRPASDVADPSSDARAEAAEALPDLARLLRSPDELPPVTPSGSSLVAPTTPDDAAPNPRLAEAAQIMAEQLARAAASGLLDIAPNEAMTIADPVQTPEQRVDVEVLVPSELSDPDAEIEVGDVATGALPIRAETAFDTIIPLGLPIGLPRPEASCDNAPFNVADWSDGGGVNYQLGALRRDLYDEREVLIADGALTLARHYLYYGFGAEAAYWLEQLQNPPAHLLHVAALVDGARTAPFIAVESGEICSDGELLWRYIAGAVPAPLTADDTAAIQRAFGSLPVALRDHMGPRLARQLAEEGYAGAARNIRDVLDRGGRIDAVELRMLDFDLGISQGESPSQTRQELAEALRDDGGDPVTVLTHALAFDRSVGVLPPPSRLVAADALIREIGQGPETDDLWLETLLAHAALGQIDEAIQRLGDPDRSETARAEALTELIAERVSVGDTAALVILAYTHGRSWRPEGSAAGRIQVRAIAALRENGLFEAAQILRDVRRPLILPAPDTASEVVEDVAGLAWREGNWPRLAETGSGPHADIAARLAQLDGEATAAAPNASPADLNSLSAALEDSRILRGTIAELLAQPALP